MPLNHGYAYRARVQPLGARQSLADYLAAHYPRASADEWRRRIERGEVHLDGCAVRADAVPRPGQALVWHRPPWDEPEVPRAWEIVACDEAFLAVNKPSGLPTLPGGGFLEQTLLFLIRQRFPEAVPMHRLGRGTSGLVLFARTEAARRSIQRAWQQREVEKRYLAVVRGCPPAHQVIDVPIGPVPHPALGALHAAHPAGKRARSEIWRRAALDGGRSLVEVLIETGRPHQIRIHLAAIGHPLDGDPLYRAGGLPDPASAVLPGALGYRLHAWKLGWAHPATGARMRLIAPLPEDWGECRRIAAADGAPQG